MNVLPRLLSRRARCLAAAGLCLTATAIARETATDVVTVFAHTSNGYTRTRLPDNSFKPETYAFASAGRLPGPEGDPSIDKLTFLQVAGVVAGALKDQGYVGAPAGKDADLLIFLGFGTTSGIDSSQTAEFRYNSQEALKSFAYQMSNQPPPNGPNSSENGAFSTTEAMNAAVSDRLEGALQQNAMQNADRDRVNARNANILGYSTELENAAYLKPFSSTGRDIVGEVEESRYFVVLQAFDYRYLVQHHQKKLLWETRFSIARHHNRFDEQLPNMAKYAAQFCGDDVGRIIRRHLPNVKVEVGTPRVVETNATAPSK